MESRHKPNRLPTERTARIQVQPSDTVRRRIPSSSPPPPEDRTVAIQETAVPRSEPETAVPDSLFQSYAILGKIGDGGMGVVYLARDKRLGRFVSIKRLNAQGQNVPSLRQRFLQEARAVAALSHPHIVHIYALGEDQDGPYIVMEYIAGPGERGGGRAAEGDRPSPPLTLDQFVSQNGPFAAADAVERIIKIGRAISYAHSCGVIHRDLKPGNVLLDKFNEPKIVDFGLARLIESEENKLTVPGEKLLSLGYGAPEQEQDASLSDERADVYGLGALFYFALTGQNPRYFREQDIPVSFRDVLVKALAMDREQRFSSAAAFTDALLATQNKTYVPAPTAKTTWHCKWCDTVNPLTLRYCAECGWDGGETCPECGAETFVGIQYCGTCGADARSYELLLQALQRMRSAMTAHQYERVLSHSSRVHGFESAGPSGRRLQKESQDLREQAERNLARREELREQIPLEMRAGNYERALTFIREIRSLDENQRLFEEEERRIPELTLTRDLGRAGRALRTQDWETASRICNEILRRVAPDTPEALRLKRRIAFYRGALQAGWIAAGVAGVLLIYLLALPAIACGARAPLANVWRGFFVPARFCYSQGPLAGVLTHYKKLWGDFDFAVAFADPVVPVAPTVTGTTEAPHYAELETRQNAFIQQLQGIDNDSQRDSDRWPTDYLNELNNLAERRRMAGEFENWLAATEAIKLFNASRQITDAPSNTVTFPELTQLIQKYLDIVSAQRIDRCRRMVTLTRRYLADLTDLQRSLTRKGQMDAAAAVNTELRRVQTSETLQKAEAELAAAALPLTPTTIAGTTTLVPKTVEALAPIQTAYRGRLDTASSNYEARVNAWPAKYTSALEGLMSDYQRQGNYDEWQKVRIERERFDADPQVRPTDIVPLPSNLAKLQQEYRNKLVEYRKVRVNEILAATAELITKYENLQKEHTVKGSMDMAASINAEIKQIRNSPEYTAARQEKQELDPPSTNRPPATPR
jgi:serine/threonine protein kinase